MCRYEGVYLVVGVMPPECENQKGRVGVDEIDYYSS